MGKPEASIIVPMYNSARVVDRCLGSLVAQTCSDIEIICVNDGSSDDSSQVVCEFAKRDSRILLFEQPNGGVSSARNTGIRAARADVLFFVDADDHIEPDAVGRILNAMRAQDAEVVVFGGCCEPEDRAPKRVRQLMNPLPYAFEAPTADLLFHSNAQPYACRAAFSRAMLERAGVLFPDGLALGEDVVFLLDSFMNSKKTVLVSDCLYHYVMDDASATHGFNDGSARIDKLDAHILMLRSLLKDWQSYACIDRFQGDLITWFLDLVVFDLVRLDSTAYSSIASRIADVFAQFYGAGWSRLPQKAAIRRVANKIESGAGTRVTVADATAFYLASRGLKACLERFI